MKVAMNELRGEGKAAWSRVGKYHVMTRYREKITHKGKPWASVDLVFSSYQLK